MAKLASKTYGEALFELAKEKNVLDETALEIANIAEAIAENKDFIKILNHPKIIKEEKLSLVEKIFKGKVSDITCGLITTIVEKDRYNEFDKIFEYFINKVKEYNKIGVAYVTSAIKLKENNKKAIEKKLVETTNYDKFEIHYKVDENIIGGLIIRIGDRVVDSSVRTKINTISKELNKLQVS